MNVEKPMSIGDVARSVGVPAHTIRYWEKEFGDFLHPKRGNGSRRQFGQYEVNLLMRIRHMLYEEKYSVAGARQKLRKDVTGNAPPLPQEMMETIINFVKGNRILGAQPDVRDGAEVASV